VSYGRSGDRIYNLVAYKPPFVIYFVLRISLMSLAFLTLGACQALTGISHRYPASWPNYAQVSSLPCGDIGGSYVNRGICNYPDHCESVSLLQRMHADEQGSTSASPVSIAQPSRDRIEVSHSNTEGAVPTVLRSSAEEFLCKDGAVLIMQGKASGAHGMGISSHTHVMAFRKASDGSLIGQHRNTSYGMFMWLVPFGGTQILWYKWEPAK
jgi:hypothetical protein